MTVEVFLSVGRTSSDAQELVIKSLEETLRISGVTPRTVGRNDFSSKAPLKRIEEVLDECHGTVVLAFERLSAPTVVTRRGSPDEGVLSNVRLPTVWNQIEAAMSYRQGLPLLMIVEDGLLPEGLLEARYDWFVQTIAVDVASLQTNEFRAVLADWIDHVKSHATAGVASAAAPARDVASLPVSELLKSLTLPQIWSVLGAAAAMFIAVAVAAYKLGAS